MSHADDPLWSDLFEEVRQDVTYRDNYDLLLRRDEVVPNGRWYYQIRCFRPDAITGEKGFGYGGKAYLSPHATRSELVQTAFGLFKGYEEHECREFFRWRERAVYGPHGNVEVQWLDALYTDARAQV